MIEGEKLILDLNRLKVIVPSENERYYYHIESISNFIFHLKNIQNEKIRNSASKSLNDCLEFVISKTNSSEDLSIKYKEIFSKHIYQISLTFRDELGFIQKPYIPLNIIIFAIIFLIFYFTVGWIIALLLVSLIAITNFLFVTYKMKKRKYY